MNPLAAALLVICGVALMVLPRRWAPVALILGMCYVTRAQELQLGPFNFTIVRVLLVIGALRIIARGEFIGVGVGRRTLDWLLIVWGGLMVLTVAFHEDPANQGIERLGLVFDAFGGYFLIRCLCGSWEELCGLCRAIGVILMPVAFSMLIEKSTTHNFFAFLGGVLEISHMREGHLRAQGPFAHAILAGTVGAVCLPFSLISWRTHRAAALFGAVSCMSIVFASGSSGPILSAAAAIGALMLWPFRTAVRWIRWGALFGYVALDLVMKDPAYFILARIDLTGGSTGWHRARLIQSSIEHLNEWWLFGTDHTRHWMPTGVSWSPNHTDITNHYLYLGVLGGLPLIAGFIILLRQGFADVGRHMRSASVDKQFGVWALGAALFSHAVTMVSVSYFDSTVFFLYMTLGFIGSAQCAGVLARSSDDLPDGIAQPRPGALRLGRLAVPARPSAEREPIRSRPRMSKQREICR